MPKFDITQAPPTQQQIDDEIARSNRLIGILGYFFFPSVVVMVVMTAVLLLFGQYLWAVAFSLWTFPVSMWFYLRSNDRDSLLPLSNNQCVYALNAAKRSVAIEKYRSAVAAQGRELTAGEVVAFKLWLANKIEEAETAREALRRTVVVTSGDTKEI